MAIGTHTNRPAHLKPAPSFSLKGNQIGKKSLLPALKPAIIARVARRLTPFHLFFRSQMTSTPWFFLGENDNPLFLHQIGK